MEERERGEMGKQHFNRSLFVGSVQLRLRPFPIGVWELGVFEKFEHK